MADSTNPFDDLTIPPALWSEEKRIDAARWFSKHEKPDELRKNLKLVSRQLEDILSGGKDPPRAEGVEGALLRLQAMVEIWRMALRMAIAN